MGRISKDAEELERLRAGLKDFIALGINEECRVKNFIRLAETAKETGQVEELARFERVIAEATASIAFIKALDALLYPGEVDHG